MKFFHRIFRSFSLSANEQASSLLLLACFAVVIIVNLHWQHHAKNIPSIEASEKFLRLVYERDSIAQAQKKSLYLFDPNTADSTILAKLDLPYYIKRNIINYRAKGGVYRSKNDVRKIYGMTDSIFECLSPYLSVAQTETSAPKSNKPKPNPKATTLFNFNPNTIAAQHLDSLALPAFIKQNLLKYREHGGSFMVKSDFKKLYGITPEIYQSIEAYLTLPSTLAYDTPQASDSIPLAFIELNSTTAEELQKLHGIGPKLAERILKYRDLLGGYAQTEQLYFVYGMPQETVLQNLAYVSCDKTKISKIKLNFVSYSELARHPLISSEQAKKIIKLRAKKGSFTNEKNLNESIFSNNEYKLIQYYLKY
ncbi:MAG: helix-hairpin-helix domain-containing protein [Mangrovibacterium sp.]